MAKNPTPSQLDAGQIIKRVFDDDNDSFRVDANVTFEGSTQEVIISHADDSIRLGDGTKIVTATTVDSDVGLDVNIIGGVVSGDFQSSGLQKQLKSQSIIITEVPTKVPAIPIVDRNAISIRVWGTNVVYFGDASVTVEDGYPKKQFEEISLDVKDNAAVEIYAVCSIGQTCELRIMELA